MQIPHNSAASRPHLPRFACTTLHSAGEPYRTLVEQMQEGAVIVTRSGDILYSNARFAALVGETLGSVVGSAMSRFVNEADRKDFEALLGTGSGRCRSSLIDPASGAFEVSLSLTTTVSRSGDRLNVIVTDLRELFEANTGRERAERDSQTKDRFLAMLAHELRTPLGAISSAVRVLELTHAEGESATRAHEVIGRQVLHISQLVDDLLDVERVVSGKIRLRRQPLDLAHAVQRVIATLVDERSLPRHIDVSVESVWVDADAMRLEQVVTNILTNAIKYTPPDGQIRVALRAEDGDAVLTVEDTGFGISAMLLPFIFDLYVQADRTIDSAQGGLGIGLPLVRRLIELHGGTIAASSGGEGQGSRFTVRLRQIPQAGRPADATVSPERRARPRRVLLIEDSDDAREMLRTMLQFEGHDVYAAADGVRGLELLNVVHPEVGIIDISLPRMDGYQIARRIRQEPHGRTMLLLALTGYGSASDSQRASEHGFDHHLIKPVDPDLLTRLIGEGAEA